MNVLIIAQYFPPDMGGGATRAYNVAKGLKLNGCKVTVITAFPHYPSGNIPVRYRWKALRIETFDGLKVIRTFVPPVASERLAKRLVLFLSFIVSSLFALPYVGKVDVIWAANPNILCIFPAMLYGMLKRRHITMNVDDLWPEDLHSFGLVHQKSPIFKMMRLAAKFAYTVARLITPISPGYVEVICKKYGASCEKVRVIRAGVDLSKFKPVYTKSSTKGNCFKVIYSGAFSVAYDFDQILLAAKILENFEGIEFILQGGGELANHIKARVSELGLNNVKVIDRILSREEVAKLLNEADALILPLRDFGSPYLGISSKLYEYQAVGKPVICCAEGEPARYVKETMSGIVVKPGDYKGLANAVLLLKNNPDVAQRIGLSGRHYVEKYLSIEAVGLEFKRIFEQLLQACGSQ